MESSPPQSGRELALISESESNSQLSSLLEDLSQSIQTGMGNMLKDDKNSTGIKEEIEKSKDSVFNRKKSLEEEKDHFQKAAYAVLNMLNTRDSVDN